MNPEQKNIDDSDWPNSVVQDIVDRYTHEWLVTDADVQSQGTLTELCGETINTMASEDQIRILDAFGDRDLSEPTVDLSCGWDNIRACLAHTALEQAAIKAFPPETLL